ncbi:MAG: methylmalonyl-CoA mutase small subunit [Breznakibacter sp.]
MADNKNQLLFSDFPPVSTQEWMDKITTDLKGADFEKKLMWKTNEGFSVRPFYRNEDLEPLSYLSALPGEFPYVRGNSAKSNQWKVRQEIVVTDIQSANKKALELLNKGVDALGFHFDSEALISETNMVALLNGIIVEAIELNFSTAHGNKKLVEALVAALKQLKCNAEGVIGSLNLDPLGNLTVTGSSCSTIEALFDYTKEVADAAKAFPHFKTLSVNARHFNNAGSTIVQELAFGLSMGAEYLNQLTSRGLSIDEAAQLMKFNFGVGSNYFMEIAKFRAARLLWSKIVEAYKPASLAVCKMQIHAETSEWNKTIFDPNVNMLRTQTEAMSAALGGVESLTVLPYDVTFKTSDVFSERIARNQQLLLKEESHFDKIVDVAGGSYYIENLTNSIATEAWKLFLEVEDKGGYLAALNAGFIQGLVKTSADARRKNIATRRENLLGTNQFPNNNEAMASRIEKKGACCQQPSQTTVEPIVLFRGAEEFEALRLATEKAAKRPKVFMLTYGNLAMRLARSQFSGNFFGCAGYEIIDNLGFDTIEAGVAAAKAAKADIVVLCSSDDEYTEAAPAAFKALNGEAQFVVAGAPACTDELKAQGIQHFINVKSNVLETLKGFNAVLGIE